MRLWWAIGLFAAGCHLLLPLGPRQERPGDGAAPDLRPLEQGADSADGAAPGGTPALASQYVNCGCASAGDDCDGLPEPRDPEPGVCNELILEQVFASDPVAAGQWRTINGPWSWRPGWLEQGSTAVQTAPDRYLWATQNSTTLGESHYLVEARLRLGAIGKSDQWWAGVVARVSAGLDAAQQNVPDELIGCSVWVNHDETCYGCSPQRPVVNPDLVLESRAGGEADWWWAWPLENPQLVDGSPGSVVLLQLWVREDLSQLSVQCRVADGQGKLLRQGMYQMYGPNVDHAKHLPAGPGRIGLRTRNRAAELDYVRVFRLHNDAT